MKWRLRIRIVVEEQHTENGPWVEGMPCMDACAALPQGEDLHYHLADVGEAVSEYMVKSWPTGPGKHVHVGPAPVRLVKEPG